MHRWREYFLVILVAIICALIVRNYIFTAYKVPSSSMHPSLMAGDFIFTYRLSYQVPFFSSERSEEFVVPERGDLVVFSYPNEPDVTYVKRVIGLPGDRIEIKKGRLLLNEIPLSYESLANQDENPNPDLFDIFIEKFESYSWRVTFKKNTDQKNFGPLVIPPGEVFLLGDNRDASDDSRYWGTVPIPQVEGKVTFIWLSFDWNRKWVSERVPSVRWERVFTTPY